jgi:hypothetical protein
MFVGQRKMIHDYKQMLSELLNKARTPEGGSH